MGEYSMFPPPSEQTQFRDHATSHLDRAATLVRSVGGDPEEVLEFALLAYAAGDYLFALKAAYELSQLYADKYREPTPPEEIEKLKAQYWEQKRLKGQGEGQS